MDGSTPGPRQVVVLGIGNLLLSDDGIGIHVTDALTREAADLALNIRDGGTIGLSLLAEIDPEAPFIAVDAMELHAAPGTLRVFRDDEMDRQLTGTKRSAHEVALADLMQAADLAGYGPRRRALVAIQPDVTTWGLAPTPAVAAAIPSAVAAVRALVEGWRDER